MLAVFAPLLAASTVEAKKVAVLRFGGANGSGARAKIARALRGQHTVLGATAVPDACADLGIPMSKGRNLARCAKTVGATAVIGGTTNARQLTLVIFSGKTGRVIGSGRVRWSSFPSSRMVRGAMRVIRRALAKAPAWVGKRPRRPRRPRRPAKVDPPDEPGGLTFEPDDIGSSKPDGGKSGGGMPSLPEEDPLAKGGSKQGEGDGKKESDAETKKEATAPSGEPRAYGVVGLGGWARTLAFNQPVDTNKSVGYTSGMAFAIQLELAARPLAFFLDNFAAGFFLRLRFQATIGLSSTLENTAETISTSMSQFILDTGYQLNILGGASSPILEFNLGYGMLDFSVDWPDSVTTNKTPGAAYRFVLLGVGASYPFVRLLDGKMPLKGMVRFDYRFVLDAGEITGEPDPGHGPGSVGGLALTLGLKSGYADFLFGLEYTYTRFFYSFTDGESRAASSLPAAGGALDQMHTVIVSGGYSF